MPIDNNKVTDTSRIKAAKNTIDKVCGDGGSCILVSHLGRPKGFQKEFSMTNIINEVEAVLKRKVILSSDIIGDDAKEKSKNLMSNQVLLLENVRFHSEETAGGHEFAKELSSLSIRLTSRR